MNLKSRLSRLEQQAASANDDWQRLLVSLLARLDALAWPFREHTGSFRPEVRRLFREYLSGVGGLRASGQGETSWKAAHFARNQLIESGRCDAVTSGGQVTGLRLTPQGLADAMALVGTRLRSITESSGVLQRIRAANGQWLSESDLFGIPLDGDPTIWAGLIDYVLPLLRAGIVESNSDLRSRSYFRSIDGVQVPAEAASSLSEASWSDSWYIASFNSERAALMRLECLDGGIVIPVRCT